MSVETLAQALHMSTSCVHAICSGRKAIGQKEIEMIAQVFAVPLERLLPTDDEIIQEEAKSVLACEQTDRHLSDTVRGQLHTLAQAIDEMVVLEELLAFDPSCQH